MPNVYDKGTKVRCRGRFTNRELTDDEQATFLADGTLPVGVGVDPSTVRFKFETPAGADTTYTYPTDSQLAKVAAGSYYVDLDANAEYTWTYRFQGEGSGQSADEQRFVVEESRF